MEDGVKRATVAESEERGGETSRKLTATKGEYWSGITCQGSPFGYVSSPKTTGEPKYKPYILPAVEAQSEAYSLFLFPPASSLILC